MCMCTQYNLEQQGWSGKHSDPTGGNMSEEKIGICKWFNQEKGYGFLVVEGITKDVFMHVKQLRASGIAGSPVEGERLGCVVNEGTKGFFATNLSKKGSSGALA